MKTATIRQVRHDLGTVLAWVAQGEEVTVLKRTRPVARILPPRPAVTAPVPMPDFAARARAIFGNRRTRFADLVLEERERSRW
jgi:antitoxin (DNA-binding transcriptional repressor) of toxin-antitoxin stability system